MTAYWELTAYHWAKIEEELYERLSPCSLCPRNCGVDRPNEAGACGIPGGLKIGFVSFLASNFSPEPEAQPVGYIQLAGCQLDCSFCCYYVNTQELDGIEASPWELADTLLDMQRSGFKAAVLSTAVHQAPWVAQGLRQAAEAGVRLPVLLETAGYESLEVLDIFRQMVSGFIVGLKFGHDDVAERYVGVPDYATRAKQVTSYLTQMMGCQPVLQGGSIVGGFLIRLLVMPGLVSEAISILDWIVGTLGPDTAVQVLDCYYPQGAAKDDPVLGRKVAPVEVETVLNYAASLGMNNVFV